MREAGEVKSNCCNRVMRLSVVVCPFPRQEHVPVGLLLALKIVPARSAGGLPMPVGAGGMGQRFFFPASGLVRAANAKSSSTLRGHTHPAIDAGGRSVARESRWCPRARRCAASGEIELSQSGVCWTCQFDDLIIELTRCSGLARIANMLHRHLTDVLQAAGAISPVVTLTAPGSRGRPPWCGPSLRTNAISRTRHRTSGCGRSRVRGAFSRRETIRRTLK